MERRLYRNKINKLIQNLYIFVFLFVVIPTIGLQGLGILHPLELAHYDLQFLLRKQETINNNITIVEWDEQSIQSLEEPMISDRTLVASLEKIIKHKPRVIGLDLYRDLPVAANGLDLDDNQKAYQSLQTIFSRYPNIIGIQKVISPITNPPETLKKKEKLAAADLPTDSDFRLRRAYIFPYTNKKGDRGAGIPYIGTALGYKFLESEGWQASDIPYGIKFEREEREISLKAIGSHFYLFNDPGLDFLINWRFARRSSFNRVSVSDLVKDKIEPWLFSDRLVILGNTTDYSDDIHRTALERWDLDQLGTNGVEVVANVASSIIDAAKNDRSFISIVPLWLERLILVLACLGLAAIANFFLVRRNTLIGLRLATLIYVLGTIFVLWTISSTLFILNGLWFDIVPTCLAILWGWVILTNYCQVMKEQQDFNYLRLLIRDFNHNLGSTTAHIRSCNEGIIKYIGLLKSQLYDEMTMGGEVEINFDSTQIGDRVESIVKRTHNINKEIARISVYQKRTSGFLNYTSSRNFSKLEAVNVNSKIFEVAENTAAKYNLKNVKLIYSFDNSIEFINLYSEDLPIVVENLVSNSFQAIESKSESRIKIATKNHRRFIELTVEDNGIGIAPKSQVKIFEPFVTSQHNRQGMGLFLVRQIVQNRGGLIKLSSKPNVGSKFSLFIPK